MLDCTLTTPELLERARQNNRELCKGRTWRMCIPARPNEDDDLVFGEVARRLEKAEAELASWKQRAEECEFRMRGLEK